MPGKSAMLCVDTVYGLGTCVALLQSADSTYSRHNMSFVPHVKKVDDVAEFAAIKTGITDWTQLKKHEQNQYNVWYNHFAEKKHTVGTSKRDIRWVADHWTAIVKFIVDTLQGPNLHPSESS